jgi:hypothetical protein
MSEEIIATKLGIESINDPSWLLQNETRIREVFPKEWTHFPDLTLSIGYKLKLLGLVWCDLSEFAEIMAKFTDIGIILQHNGYIRINPKTIEQNYREIASSNCVKETK